MIKSKVLKTLVPSGDPNGLKIIEISGWSGKCFVVPRNNLKELKDRPENNSPGIYFLFGDDEETNNRLAYIGESESFFGRISNHDSNKSFWETAVIFVGGLNRADVKYLEYKATKLSQKTNRFSIQNKVQPNENSLSEADKITAEQFFENISFLLSTLGYELFEEINRTNSDSPTYSVSGEGFEATGKILDNGDFVVNSGSLARIHETESFDGGWASNARKKFLKENKLAKKDELSLIFKEDIVFKSPSAAAATVAGRSINGWTAWKDSNGDTLDENVRK